jgi:hypothetical protein
MDCSRTCLNWPSTASVPFDPSPVEMGTITVTPTFGNPMGGQWVATGPVSTGPQHGRFDTYYHFPCVPGYRHDGRRRGPHSHGPHNGLRHEYRFCSLTRYHRVFRIFFFFFFYGSNNGPFSGAIVLADQIGSYSTDPSDGALFTTSSFTTTTETVSYSLTEISGTETYIPITKTIQTVLPTVVSVSSHTTKR